MKLLKLPYLYLILLMHLSTLGCEDDAKLGEATVLGDAVYNPNPAIGAIEVSLDVELMWERSEGSTDFRIYLSEDLEAVTQASEVSGSGTDSENRFTPEEMLNEDEPDETRRRRASPSCP